LRDHRAVAVDEIRGVHAVVAFNKSVAELTDQYTVVLADVLALTPNAVLVRWSGSGLQDGGQFELPSYMAGRFGPHGAFDRCELFDDHALDEAWAAFDRLDRQ